MGDFEENVNALRRIALSMERRSAVDYEDLWQEGLLNLCQGLSMKACIGEMKGLVRKECLQRTIKREVLYIHNQLRRVSRAFEGLDDIIKTLPEKHQDIIKLWLQGDSLSSIGRAFGVTHPTIKRYLIESFKVISEWCGEQTINLSFVFPKIETCLPTGIRFRGGSYIAYHGRGGKNYLGSFHTLEEAKLARSNHANL